MYQGGGSGPIVPIATGTVVAAAPALLPNTGSNSVVTIAMAVGAGLLVWGVLHIRSMR